jgi:hypothetical protein
MAIPSRVILRGEQAIFKPCPVPHVISIHVISFLFQANPQILDITLLLPLFHGLQLKQRNPEALKKYF